LSGESEVTSDFSAEVAGAGRTGAGIDATEAGAAKTDEEDSGARSGGRKGTGCGEDEAAAVAADARGGGVKGDGDASADGSSRFGIAEETGDGAALRVWQPVEEAGAPLRTSAINSSSGASRAALMSRSNPISR